MYFCRLKAANEGRSIVRFFRSQWICEFRHSIDGDCLVVQNAIIRRMDIHVRRMAQKHLRSKLYFRSNVFAPEERFLARTRT